MSHRVGFINHLKLAFDRNTNTFSHSERMERGNIKSNGFEKAGDIMTWHVTELPKKIFKAAKDPRVITVALTALAMLATTLAFYPTITIFAVKTAAVFIVKNTPWLAVKATLYALSMLGVLGLGTRSLGRFGNEGLMAHYYRSYGLELDLDGEFIPLAKPAL